MAASQSPDQQGQHGIQQGKGCWGLPSQVALLQASVQQPQGKVHQHVVMLTCLFGFWYCILICSSQRPALNIMHNDQV